eukprot:1947512-Karenia_brevis.AAC.1
MSVVKLTRNATRRRSSNSDSESESGEDARGSGRTDSPIISDEDPSAQAGQTCTASARADGESGRRPALPGRIIKSNS